MIFPLVSPVSYTHLDVYKRQASTASMRNKTVSERKMQVPAASRTVKKIPARSFLLFLDFLADRFRVFTLRTPGE